MITINTVNGHLLAQVPNPNSVYHFLRHCRYQLDALIIKALGVQYIENEIRSNRVAVAVVQKDDWQDVFIDTDFDRLAEVIEENDLQVVRAWVQGEEIQ